MAEYTSTSNNRGLFSNFLYEAQIFARNLLGRFTGHVDLRDKLVLLDNDELLLVWETKLRNQRLKKEEEAWKRFEKQFGKGSPAVTEAFLKWQEQLYAYIEQEKDRFLKVRQGSSSALEKLLQAGAKNIIVTKGAKPYTQKCFNLVGLGTAITSIYSPAPGSREKRFVDAVLENGKTTTVKYLRDTVIVGHDLEKDMAWDLVPAKGRPNDGNAPVFIFFSALKFGNEVVDPLDALVEIIALLSRRGKNDFLRGFKSITKPKQAMTKNYTFKIALYHNPKRSDKARIPVIHEIKPRR